MEKARLFSPNGCDVFEMYEDVDLPDGWQIYISDGGALKLDPQRIAIPADRWGPVRYGFAFSPIHVYRTKEEAETASAYRKTKYDGAAVPFPLGGWVWIEAESGCSRETVEERALAFFAEKWPNKMLDKKVVIGEDEIRGVLDELASAKAEIGPALTEAAAAECALIAAKLALDEAKVKLDEAKVLATARAMFDEATIDGKNAEARKAQIDAYLLAAPEVVQAQEAVSAAEKALSEAEAGAEMAKAMARAATTKIGIVQHSAALLAAYGSMLSATE